MSHGISEFQKLILDVISLTANKDGVHKGKSLLKSVLKEAAIRYSTLDEPSHSFNNSFYRAIKSLEKRKLIERDRSKGKMNQMVWRLDVDQRDDDSGTEEYFLPG